MSYIISQMFDNNKKIFTAPLAGITDKPFRAILRDFAPDVSMVTEMISCHSLVDGHKNCIRNFDNYANEGNIGAQIFGADARLMGEAAKILQDSGAKWIDINMGCPVPKVATRAGAGAFLMRDHKLAGEIIKSCVRAVKIPVSVKTRLGWDETHKDWQELARIAADSGAAFVALHGRTRAQGYSGNAELPTKPELPIPIIANGDIKNINDVEHVQKLGYDGAMIGRAMLGQPWIIGQICGTATKPQNIGNVVLKHLNLIIDYYGAKAFCQVHDFLLSGEKCCCMSGYMLKNTLSDNGAVTRGICEVENGYLTRITETRNVIKTSCGAEADGKALDPESLVSMNMWGFGSSFINEI
ncbi:MAG: tRNA-dihydrouridine synthase, partial [Alphaproteobacteria bacterium]|nr:tRNA-dihydrouridine synthase [Alphaproteobacteria bacterium]